MGKMRSEPMYLAPQPTETVLSEVRTVKIHPQALLCLNILLDELLLNFLSSSSSTTTSPAPKSFALGTGEVITTDAFKTGVLRVVGSQFGKEVVLEAELAVREILKIAPPSLRGDAALRKAYASTLSKSGGGETIQIDDIFDVLRAQVQQLSTLGTMRPEPSASASSSSLTAHLNSLCPPPKFPPSISSPHVTFILALYAERCLIHIADYILRSVGRVTERESATESAGLAELDAALAEDDSVWSWVKGMRVRGLIDDELKGSNKGKGALGGQYSKGGRGTPPNRSSVSVTRSTASQDSTTSHAGLLYRPKMEVTQYEDENSFEALIQSNSTLKKTLTPSRLSEVCNSLSKQNIIKALKFGQQKEIERARRASTLLMSNGFNSSGSPPSLSHSASAPRLKARGAVRATEEEDEDETENIHGLGGRLGPKKESLLDILASSRQEFDPSITPPRSLRSVTPSRDLKPESSPMARSGSGNSTVSGSSSVSDYGTPLVPHAGSELYNNPYATPTKPSKTESTSPPSSSLSPQKSSGGLRGFMSKISGGNRKESLDYGSDGRSTPSYSASPPNDSPLLPDKATQYSPATSSLRRNLSTTKVNGSPRKESAGSPSPAPINNTRSVKGSFSADSSAGLAQVLTAAEAVRTVSTLDDATTTAAKTSPPLPRVATQEKRIVYGATPEHDPIPSTLFSIPSSRVATSTSLTPPDTKSTPPLSRSSSRLLSNPNSPPKLLPTPLSTNTNPSSVPPPRAPLPSIPPEGTTPFNSPVRKFSSASFATTELGPVGGIQNSESSHSNSSFSTAYSRRSASTSSSSVSVDGLASGVPKMNGGSQELEGNSLGIRRGSAPSGLLGSSSQIAEEMEGNSRKITKASSFISTSNSSTTTLPTAGMEVPVARTSMSNVFSSKPAESDAELMRSALERLKIRMEGVGSKAECMAVLAGLMEEYGEESSKEGAGKKESVAGDLRENGVKKLPVEEGVSEEERLRHEAETLEASVYELFLGGADIYVHEEKDDEEVAQEVKEAEVLEEPTQKLVSNGTHVEEIRASPVEFQPIASTKLVVEETS